ncbi:MAG: elongation factor P [Phycisphaerales bacterium]|nr:elongation factor P [Phycisphaerales bacterium]
MPIKATDLKRGQALLWDGQLHVVIDTDHVKPGKGPAYVQAKMKNVDTGTIKTNRINSSDKLEDVSIDRRSMQYLYDGSGHGKGPFVFMDGESFEQIELDGDLLGDKTNWLVENLDCTVMIFDGRALGVDLPAAVEMTITDTAPQPKGATATNQLKEATVETGARVRVPPFIDIGQRVRINSETGEYLGKA